MGFGERDEWMQNYLTRVEGNHRVMKNLGGKISRDLKVPMNVGDFSARISYQEMKQTFKIYRKYCRHSHVLSIRDLSMLF